MLRFAANISLLFREQPFLERFAAARAAGFSGVEIQFPYEYPAQVLASAADQAGVPIVLINAPVRPDLRPGIACRPELRAAFRVALEEACSHAAALHVPRVNILAGTAEPAELRACRSCLIENLLLGAENLERVGARALLEPLNALDVPGYCVPDFESAAEILAATAARVDLQFDIYHAARMGVDPEAAFVALHRRIGHVQFADAPGRHEPGTGHLPIGHIFRSIAASNYSGWIGAEYHPLRPSRESVAWLHERAATG
jgi:hydroxypyruvate isomerase